MSSYIRNDWDAILAEEFSAPYYSELRRFVWHEYRYKTVYPPQEEVYHALKLTPPESVRVVILGQDPYINPGQAQGLAFSVPEGISPPPSLKNIYRELCSDTGLPFPETGCLIPWAQRGVLLLNTTLTVAAGASNSHAGKGWEQVTDAIIAFLGQRRERLVFFLWGRHAQSKEPLIDLSRGHLVLKAPHPSPLSAGTGFFGSRPFSQANAFFRKHGLPEMDWNVGPVND